MGKNLDIVIINPGDKKQVYQDLEKDFSGIEPPFWAAVIAAYLRNKNFRVDIIDVNAENFSPYEVSRKIKELDPLLSVVIVYGSQPSASTQNMTSAGKICQAINENTNSKIAIGGLHPSALPRLTLEQEKCDFVIEGEGPVTLEQLLPCLRSGKNDFSTVPGLWYYKGKQIQNNPRAGLINNLDEILPIAAWDLLSMQKYRAHNWHCFDNIDERAPYGVIYTSLGCPYGCIFCCINAPFGKPSIRYRSPELVIKEIELLAQRYGITNLKIADELFILSEKHYMTIVDLIIKRGYKLNIWAYARVDTIKAENLEKMKKAGINWIALGIESANPKVREGALKNVRVKDIQEIVRSIQGAGIRVIGNYIFGLPDDTLETMRETLDMAITLNCEYANFYCAMAYPGSKLYDIAVKEGWVLPDEWHGYSQYSYETLPLPTRFLPAKEVLQFRDDAFHAYFENRNYLNMLKEKFGDKVRCDVENMAKIQLKRKLFSENKG